jgi:hypothetical protein
LAIIKKGNIENLSGRLGHIVLKKFNGKNIASIRAEKYKRTKCPKARKVRDCFGDIAKFAKYINRDSTLKSIWKNLPIEGFSAYHKIMSANLLLSSNRQLGEANIIVPETIPLPVLSLTLNPPVLSIIIDKLNDQISNVDLQKITLQYIFVFKNLQEQNKTLLNIQSSHLFLTEPDINKEIKLSFNLDVNFKGLIDLYSDFNLYTTLIYQIKSEENPRWFSTYAKSFRLINDSE